MVLLVTISEELIVLPIEGRLVLCWRSDFDVGNISVSQLSSGHGGQRG